MIAFEHVSTNMIFDTNLNLLKKIKPDNLAMINIRLLKFLPITFVTNVKIKHIRAWGGRIITPETNPFTFCLRGCDEREVCRLYRERISIVRKGYSLDSKRFDKNFFLSQQYAWLNKGKPTDRFVTLKTELGIDAKDIDESTMNSLLITREVKRLLNVYNSLLRYGYSESLGDFTPIRATLAILGQKYFFLIRHGEHRVACMPHVGKSSVPLWVRSSDIIYVDKGNPTMNDWFHSIYVGKLNGPPLTNVYGYFFV